MESCKTSQFVREILKVFSRIRLFVQSTIKFLNQREKTLLAVWFLIQVILVVLDFGALAIAAITVSAFIPIVQSNPESIPNIVLDLFEIFPIKLSLYEFLFLLVGFSGLLLITKTLVSVSAERFFFLKLNLITVRLARLALDRHFSTPIERRVKKDNTFLLHSIHDSLNSYTIYVLGNLVIVCAEIVSAAILLTVMLIWKPLVTGLLVCFMALSILISFKLHIQKSHHLLQDFSHQNNESLQTFLDLNSMSSELKLRSLFQSSLESYLQRRSELGKLIAKRQSQFGFPRLILETSIILGGFLSGLLIWYTMNISQGLVLLASLMIVGLRLQPAILKIQNGIQVMYQHRESAAASLELLNFYSEPALSENYSNSNQNDKDRDLLVISNLGYKFSDQEFLFDGVNFSFSECGFYLIRGQNGVGKSTFFEVMAGLRKPYVGSIMYKNSDLSKMSQERIGLHLSYLPQKPYFQNQTIIESLLIEVEFPNSFEAELNRAIDILRILKFDLSKHDLNKRMNLDDYLSEGEKAKLGIARTLIRDTKVLLLDEPTSSLDVNSRDQLRDLIASEAKNRLILLISHDEVFDSISNGILEL